MLWNSVKFFFFWYNVNVKIYFICYIDGGCSFCSIEFFFMFISSYVRIEVWFGDE